MTDRMTDSEIVKGLYYHSKHVIGWICPVCPYDRCEGNACVIELCTDALDLFNRQKAEIEMLTAEKDLLSTPRTTIVDMMAAYDKGFTEAVKEFAERLIGKAKSTRERFLLKSLTKTVMDEMGV